MNQVIKTAFAIACLLQAEVFAVDTEVSVQEEIDAQQSKLDNILYLNLFKTLKSSFNLGILNVGHVSGGSKDDINKFHDFVDRDATAGEIQFGITRTVNNNTAALI